MREAGIDETGLAWEAYVDAPDTVAPEDLKTEIYALLPQ